MKRIIFCTLLFALCSLPVSADWKMPTEKTTPLKDSLREEMTQKYPDKKWDKMSSSDLNRLVIQMLKDNGYLPADDPVAGTSQEKQK
jgi:hypothetical protein